MFSTIFFITFAFLILAHFVFLKDREAILNSVAVAFLPSAILLLVLSFTSLGDGTIDVIVGTLMLVLTTMGFGYQYALSRRPHAQDNDQENLVTPSERPYEDKSISNA